jgi:hypothetical protein
VRAETPEKEVFNVVKDDQGVPLFSGSTKLGNLVFLEVLHAAQRLLAVVGFGWNFFLAEQITFGARGCLALSFGDRQRKRSDENNDQRCFVHDRFLGRFFDVERDPVGMRPCAGTS